MCGLQQPCLAQPIENSSPEIDLMNLSIEELMDIEITSLSKKKEKLSESAAAVYVITEEDIRRSGHTSVPDLLRMVPGLQVARINSNTWAVSSRGLVYGEYAHMMLVLVDGRSIYTPLHGGVYWDMHDVPLENIERIEVIRGPGGALWGANAVNGIINIITKSAKDTQGGLAVAGGGTNLKAQSFLRYGDKIDEDTYYRFYAKYFDRDAGRRIDGTGDESDGWGMYRTGFQVDREASDKDSFTVQGDLFYGDIGKVVQFNSLTAPTSVEKSGDFGVDGQNMLARWTRTYEDDSDMVLQTYYDRTRRRELTFDETRQTYDLDFQHRFGLNDRHEITWGLGYRLTADHINGTFDFALDPKAYQLNVYSAFLQDRISLIQDRLSLILGTKIEHNDFTGFECQPSARLVWNRQNGHTMWTSVARAVKTPTRFGRHSDTSWGVTAGIPTYSLRGYGDDGVESENVTAYELGYRFQPTKKTSLDFAAFFNRYTNLRTFEGGFSKAVNMGSYILVPYTADNKMDGETYGGEISGTYKAADNWKLNAGYSFLQIQLHPDSTSTYTSDGTIEGESPQNQFHLRSYLDLSESLEFDVGLYYVDNLPSDGTANYIRLDARLGWQIAENTELSLVGQNLLEQRHQEYNGSRGALVATEAERSFFMQLTRRF